MSKNCPKCGRVLKPPNASYCIACESYLDIKHSVKKQTSKNKESKMHCCFWIFITVALTITFVVWEATPIGSVEELITELIGLALVYVVLVFLSISISNTICQQIDEKTRKYKPGVDLSFLKPDKQISYIFYYIFVLLIILLSLLSFSLRDFYIVLSLFTLFTILGLVSFVLFFLKLKRVKYWIEGKDIIGLFALVIIIIEQWGFMVLSFYAYLFGISMVIVWAGWVINDEINFKAIKLMGLTGTVLIGKIKAIKLIGLTGPVLIVIGIILTEFYFSITNLFILYFGFYLWTGFFIIELLRRNQIPGLDAISKSKIYEDLARDAKILVNEGNKLFGKKEYARAIDNWESSLKFYDKTLEVGTTQIQKEKIVANKSVIKENIRNALEAGGNKHNKKAIKAHKKLDLQTAEIEWNSATQNFAKLINIIKTDKLGIDYTTIESKIKSIRKNLDQLEIEKLCAAGDAKLESAQALEDKDLTNALQRSTEAISIYSKALKKANKSPDFTSLVENIKTKMVNVRSLQEDLEEKMDILIGLSPLTTEVIIEDVEDSDYRKVESSLKAGKKRKALKIVREYEFIRGRVRFKIGLINNTSNPLTNFRISVDLPDALKWVMYEPNKYERKGDSIFISKLGKSEKKVVSIYLEPINCMESPINATISFFDVYDRPQAIAMNPKMISITCPIFFTKEEANLARVKKLQRSLSHRDKKVFPIVNIDKTSLIFSTVISVIGYYDIKLISKEFSEEDQFGEAWFYGITKVKKNRIITYILLDGESKTIEIEVSADDIGQITGFLAELRNRIRDELLRHNIIDSKEKFYDISMSIHLNHCPYCWNIIPPDMTQKYLTGNSIKCKYCNESLILRKD